MKTTFKLSNITTQNTPQPIKIAGGVVVIFGAVAAFIAGAANLTDVFGQYSPIVTHIGLILAFVSGLVKTILAAIGNVDSYGEPVSPLPVSPEQPAK